MVSLSDAGRVPRLADGKPNLDAPTPKPADGKPDLSGVWLIANTLPCPKDLRGLISLGPRRR